MTENAKKFLEAVSKDKELQEKFKTYSKEELIDVAQEMGMTLTEADFQAPEGELSEKELSSVSGGDSGGCYCLIGGGGGGTQTDGDIYGCACVAYGQGGDGAADDFTCWCTGYGEGNVDDPLNSLI